MSFYEQKLQKFHLFLFLNYTDLYEVFGNRALAIYTNVKGEYILHIAIGEDYYTREQAKKMFYLWDNFNPFMPLISVA